MEIVPMIALPKASRRKRRQPRWHDGFMAFLPAIQNQARAAFRHLDKEAREEAVAEVVAHAVVAYEALFQRGAVDIAYPSVLASHGIKRVKIGRRAATRMNCKDVSSEYAQLKKGISMERLDRFDREHGWQEVLLEDRHSGPAEMAASRIDIAEWFRRLRPRDRRIAKALAVGNRTAEVARRFHVSPSLISQKRRAYLDNWNEFQGDGAVR